MPQRDPHRVPMLAFKVMVSGFWKHSAMEWRLSAGS